MKLYFAPSEEIEPEKSLLVVDQITQREIRGILLNNENFDFISLNDIITLAIEGYTVIITE